MPNTYPDVPTKSGIKSQWESDITPAEDGTIRGQDLNAASLYKIKLTHTAISSAQVTTLQTFFTNNRNVVITTRTLKDGFTYNCILDQEPVVKDRSTSHKDVNQSLEGTRN